MTLAQIMYPLKNGSPKTITTADITATDVNLYIEDLSVLPDAPNVLLMYTAPTVWERCKYTLKQSSSGSGYVVIVRSGTEWASSTGAAQGFLTGAKVARNVFKSDFDAIQANLTGHETRLSTAETSLGTIDGRITTHETRLSTAETSLGTIDSRVTTLESASSMDPIVAALIFG